MKLIKVNKLLDDLQALLKAYEENFDYPDFHTGHELMKQYKYALYDVAEVIKKQPLCDDADQRRWIPVTEMLPSTDGKFEVTVGRQGPMSNRRVELTNYQANSKSWPEYAWGRVQVIAWRPRATPYYEPGHSRQAMQRRSATNTVTPTLSELLYTGDPDC